jgi:hypothetical protein
MTQGPAQQFRQWLESQPRGTGEVPFENLLRVWGVENPTPESRAWIEQGLAEAGIAAQPSLERLERHSNTTLWIHQPGQAWDETPTVARAVPAVGETPRANPIGLALIATGALIGVISLFLEWAPGETLWELYTALDVITVLLGMATIGLCVASLLASRNAFLRAALVPAAMFFALPALVTAIEFVTSPGGVEAGNALGILGSLLAGAGLAFLVISDLIAPRHGGRTGLVTALIGVAAAAFVALFVSVIQLLPAVEGFALEDSLSEWQVATVTDWVDQLAVLVLLGLAVAAAVTRLPALVLALGVLLSYFALPDLLLAFDDFANGGTFYVADFMSAVSGAVALAGSLFLVANALRPGE